MRLLYGVVFVFAIVASVSEDQKSPRRSSTPIRLFVSAPRSDSGLLPFDQKPKEDSAKDLQRAIKARLSRGVALFSKAIATFTNDKADADVTIEVVDRVARGDNRIVNLRVLAGSEEFNISGTNDDSDWSDAADDAAKQIIDWLTLNRHRLATPREGSR